MSSLNIEIYDAFRAANVPDEQARKAALSINSEIKTESTNIKIDIAEIKSELKLLKWMIGFVLAFCVAILWKLIH